MNNARHHYIMYPKDHYHFTVSIVPDRSTGFFHYFTSDSVKGTGKPALLVVPKDQGNPVLQ